MTTPQTATIRRLGEVSRTYEAATVDYGPLADEAAATEADYRRLKALFVTRMVAEGASVSRAEYAADADEQVAAACLAYKLAAATLDAAGKRLWQLRAQFDFGRSVLVNERESDRVHAAGFGGGS